MGFLIGLQWVLRSSISSCARAASFHMFVLHCKFVSHPTLFSDPPFPHQEPVSRHTLVDLRLPGGIVERTLLFSSCALAVLPG